MNSKEPKIADRNTASVPGAADSRLKGTLYDQPDSFGWLSIALHWTTAIVVVAMWFIGKNITAQPDGSPGFWKEVHVTLGLSAWVLLAGRIVWRVKVPHPQSDGLGTRTHRLARGFHYTMLAFLTLLIASGPLVAWVGYQSGIGRTALTVHRYAGNAMVVLTLIHIGGALKHLMFHDDDSIVRMLWPKR